MLLLQLLALLLIANLHLLLLLVVAVGLLVLLMHLLDAIATVLDARLAVLELILGPVLLCLLTIALVLLALFDAILLRLLTILLAGLLEFLAILLCLGAIAFGVAAIFLALLVHALLIHALAVAVFLFAGLLVFLPCLLAILDARFFDSARFDRRLVLVLALVLALAHFARRLAVGFSFVGSLVVVLALLFLALRGLVHARVSQRADTRQSHADRSRHHQSIQGADAHFQLSGCFDNFARATLSTLRTRTRECPVSAESIFTRARN
jgi:hypothetical protein